MFLGIQRGCELRSLVTPQCSPRVHPVFTGSPEELPVWKMKGKNAPKLGKMNGSRSAQLSSPTTFDAADSYAAFMVDISVEWNGLLNYKPNKPTYMWREPLHTGKLQLHLSPSR